MVPGGRDFGAALGFAEPSFSGRGNEMVSFLSNSERKESREKWMRKPPWGRSKRAEWKEEEEIVV